MCDNLREEECAFQVKEIVSKHWCKKKKNLLLQLNFFLKDSQESLIIGYIYTSVCMYLCMFVYLYERNSMQWSCNMNNLCLKITRWKRYVCMKITGWKTKWRWSN